MKRFFILISPFFLTTLLCCVNHDLSDLDKCNGSDLHIELGIVTVASDCAVADGKVQVDVTGGIKPYQFFVDDVSIQSDGFLEDMKAGVYRIKVRDQQGCEAKLENIEVAAKGLSFTTVVKEDNLCLNGNGSVTINVQEERGPYLFGMGTDFSDSNTFNNLADGLHTFYIKDNINCVVELNVTVPRGVTEVSWANEILPIVQTKCATTGCHNGISRPDLRLFKNAKFYASAIKKFTQERSMPLEGNLTQDQISLIACWVDSGALEN